MAYIKINEEYKPVTYSTTSIDYQWDMRSVVELKAPDVSYEDLKKYCEGGKWSVYNKIVKRVPDEPVEKEGPATYHEEVTYEATDMSDYCVCGWVRNNMDGSTSVKMGRLSELEEFMAATLALGGI